MTKKLLTPRGYLSWTQISMWSTNPERYVRNYMLGEKDDFRTPSMDFGSKMAKAREDRDAGDDEELQVAISLVPQFEVREHEIKATMRTGKGDIDLLGKLDSFDPRTLAFRDDKTGMTRWTQRKAEKHKQLDHYATLIYLKHGKVPQEAWLDWLETEYGPEGQVRLTGHVESFRVPITLKGVLEYMTLASRVAQEIDARYRQELDKLT